MINLYFLLQLTQIALLLLMRAFAKLAYQSRIKLWPKLCFTRKRDIIYNNSAHICY